VAGGQVVFDTTAARYVWEWPYYPQYYVPLADVGAQPLARLAEEGGARAFGDDAAEGVRGLVRFEWAALDAWYEEDEQIFVHPRNPYTRVDAVRSTRRVRVELDGVVLAESAAPVMVFETGLPARHYLNRTEVDFSHLEPSGTATSCPYKGTTTGYWSARIGSAVHADIAWSYDFPTAALLPIAGMVAFYDEKVDTYVGGELLERPRTHFGDDRLDN
jgi:uncharacterized protein (DUF427 family)